MAYITKEERRELIGFNDTLLRLIAVPLFSLFFPILVFGLWPTEDFILYIQCFFISIIHIIIFWWVEYWLVVYLRKRYVGIENYKKRIIVQGIALLISTLALTSTASLLDLCFDMNHDLLESSFFQKYMASLIITTIIISIYEARYTFELFKRGLIANEELQKKNAQAQLEVLKNQVNPHFLFNSLNTLISVIPENPNTAVAFTENLSNVYRYLLEIRNKEVTSLKEELECINAYEFLLKIRFEDAVRIEYPKVQPTEERFLIPLSIQMLIENAIKHNIVSQQKQLTIKITIEGDFLVVSNNLQPKLIKEPSTNVGLENIDRRYELLIQKNISIHRTEHDFSVKIPLLKMTELK